MYLSRIVLLITVCLLLTATAKARPVPAWSYEKLIQESDLVVIVEPTKVRDATPDDRMVGPAGLEDHVAGVVTSFRILAVLKGRYDQQTLEIKHFREIPVNDHFLGNGPCFISFKDLLVTEKKDDKRSKPQQCLLFLEKLPSGEYEFVTGQADPIFSVKQMRDVPPQWPE